MVAGDWRLPMEHPLDDKNAVGFFYGVFYQTGTDEDSIEWIFLAAFDSEDKAIEYCSRPVWQHLDTYISKQPIY